jgi:predicted RNA polymerase sigma factor
MLRMAESNVCAIFLVKGEFYDHRNGSYQAHGKECGIQEVIQTNYQPFWAARGHLLQLLNQKDEARKAFTRAASLTDDPALREYLFKRSANNI